jgi:poly(ADP-ribose) glycohydrolase ARH3
LAGVVRNKTLDKNINHMISFNKYIGCFLGLAIGDSYGAPFEGGLIERLMWKLLGKTKEGLIRYTDDTQMAMDIANSYLEKGEINQEHLANTFSANYQWSRGYGPSAAKLLKKIRSGAKWQEVNRAKFKDGSYGNGAAMRAPIIAMCFPNNSSKLKENVAKASEITHAHNLAIEGAQLIAFVTASCLNDVSLECILKSLADHCESQIYRDKISYFLSIIKEDKSISINEIRKNLGNGIAASESCVTAIYFGLRYTDKDIESMLHQIFKLGGDTDTIASMAGAIWGAANGSSTPLEDKIRTVENSEYILELAKKLHAVKYEVR